MQKTNHIETLRFSVFYSDKGIFETKPKESVSIERLMLIYKSQFLQEKTLELREAISTGDEDRVTTLKNKLPFFTPNGSFDIRKNESINVHNDHLIALDIDGLTEMEAEQVKSTLSNQPSVLMTAISPRKKGVKCLVLIKSKIEANKRFALLQSNKELIANSLCIGDYWNNIDRAQFTLSQPCYFAFDEDIYCNMFAEPLTIELAEPKPIKEHSLNYTKSLPEASNRIEAYILKIAESVNTKLLATTEQRHPIIAKVKMVAEIIHYAPSLESELKDMLFSSVNGMYGGFEAAKLNGAHRAFESAWKTQAVANKTIETIIHESIVA
jgi:hypothetical protein